ncbi:hypothetical protein ACS0TY_034506 [Phlomoides rotata]
MCRPPPPTAPTPRILTLFLVWNSLVSIELTSSVMRLESSCTHLPLMRLLFNGLSLEHYHEWSTR